MISMMHAAARRSAGMRDPSSSSIERAWGDPAGCTTAVPWKLMVAGGDRRHQRQDPAPAHKYGHRDPAVGRDVPGLPAAGRDRDDQPSASGLVHDAAGPRLPGRGDVAEHGERGPGDRLPHLLAGQPWPSFAALAADRPGRHDRTSSCRAAPWSVMIDARTGWLSGAGVIGPVPGGTFAPERLAAAAVPRYIGARWRI